MNSEQFCYWLQGFIEIQDPTEIDSQSLEVIKDHLRLVFKKETPTRNRLPDLKKKDLTPSPLFVDGNTRYCSSAQLTEELKELETIVSC